MSLQTSIRHSCTLWSQKDVRNIFYHNFDNFQPILKIMSLLGSELNFQQNSYHYIPLSILYEVAKNSTRVKVEVRRPKTTWVKVEVVRQNSTWVEVETKST